MKILWKLLFVTVLVLSLAIGLGGCKKAEVEKAPEAPAAPAGGYGEQPAKEGAAPAGGYGEQPAKQEAAPAGGYGK